MCDDLNNNCNVITDLSFENDLEFKYESPGITTVGGVDYDVVIQLLPGDDPITHTWEVYPDHRRDPFDCSTSKMWFDNTIVGATTYWRRFRRKYYPYCVFDIHDGILTSSFIESPNNRIFFLFDSITGNRDYLNIDKNFDTPIIPKSNYDDSFNPTIVCDEPEGDECDVIETVSFVDKTSVDWVFEIGTGTRVNGTLYDSVVKWIPNVNTTIDSSWELFAKQNGVPIDCTKTKLWMNGTIAYAISKTRATNDDKYCVYDMANGLLSDEYLANPGQTKFFLFESGFIAEGETVVIQPNHDNEILSIREYADLQSDTPEQGCQYPFWGINCNMTKYACIVNCGLD